MRILLVEDDERKRLLIEEYLAAVCSDAVVESVYSYHSALRRIRQRDVDILLLDMSLTTFDLAPDEDGGTPRPYGGRELLRQMDRHDIAIPTILVTQYPRFGEGPERITLSELDEMLREEHAASYVGSVYYNESMEGWREDLLANIAKIQEKAGE